MFPALQSLQASKAKLMFIPHPRCVDQCVHWWCWAAPGCRNGQSRTSDRLRHAWRQMSKRSQFFTSYFIAEAVENVNLVASTADANDSRANLFRFRISIVTAKPPWWLWQDMFRSQKCDTKSVQRKRAPHGQRKSSFQVNKYDYTHIVLTVTVESGPGPDNLEKTSTDGQSQRKYFWADVEVVLIGAWHGYWAPQELPIGHHFGALVFQRPLYAAFDNDHRRSTILTGGTFVRVHM